MFIKKSGKIEKNGKNRTAKSGKFRTLREKENNKYLGILEIEMKEKKEKKRVPKKNAKNSQNKSRRQKSNQRNNHPNNTLYKILETILKLYKGWTRMNGPKGKENRLLITTYYIWEMTKDSLYISRKKEEVDLHALMIVLMYQYKNWRII